MSGHDGSEIPMETDAVSEGNWEIFGFRSFFYISNVKDITPYENLKTVH